MLNRTRWTYTRELIEESVALQEAYGLQTGVDGVRNWYDNASMDLGTPGSSLALLQRPISQRKGGTISAPRPAPPDSGAFIHDGAVNSSPMKWAED